MTTGSWEEDDDIRGFFKRRKKRVFVGGGRIIRAIAVQAQPAVANGIGGQVGVKKRSVGEKKLLAVIKIINTFPRSCRTH